ncbi:MAG: translation elongation factor Ts [Candidatus Wolfebacteria bacterium]|nr:translation elongation factor Ts [Candidatus Wolfebacteria bacterium]
MVNSIQQLRDITGAGVMECKRALEEADNDLEKAKAIIFEKGLVKADKKSERSTGSGILETYVHNGRVAVLLKLLCETDFVARNDLFKELAHQIAMHIAAMNPENIDELLKQNFIMNEEITVEDLIKQSIAKLGENMKLEKFCRYEL